MLGNATPGSLGVKAGKECAILIAEDDDDDYLLTKKAFQESSFRGSVHRVRDGEELMKFLLPTDSSQATAQMERTCLLLLLDLCMPRKDGREALKEIKSHPGLKKIPVVVLTTSTAEADVVMAYELGANSFIKKPASFALFVEVIKSLVRYWFEFSELPPSKNSARSSI